MNKDTALYILGFVVLIVALVAFSAPRPVPGQELNAEVVLDKLPSVVATIVLTPLVLLFAGVHPNCESMTLLVSDGKTYRGINHYLKRPLSELAVECAEICKQLEPQLDRLDPGSATLH